MSPTNYSRYKYTPDEIDEGAFLERFVVRTEVFEDLNKELMNTDYKKPQQHFIIVGQRGQGKTTLLRRLLIAVEQNEELSSFLIPVKFAEEQYQIRSLSRLWEEVADYLQSIHPELFVDILDQMEARFDDDDYELMCFSYLEKYVKAKNKKLLLLIDNIDELLGKLKEKEQHQLREILISSPTFRIIGGSTKMIEQHYDYGKPFYEFFHTVRLQSLDSEECIRFLQVIGDETQQTKINQVIEASPARIEILRRMTGGVPRTMVMLFDIFIDDEGNAFEDLLKVLDEATPLYKHRMDDLPATLQDITHAIAMNWDGLGTKEIAAKTRLTSKETSAQLKQLENKYGIIESESTGKNKIYKLEERFFNIWYLMRFGRKRDRQKVEWLVRFLNSWCSADELETRAHRFLNAVKDGRVKPNYAYHMCEALSYAGLEAKTEYLVKEGVREYLHTEGSNLVNDISHSNKELYGQALDLYDKGVINEAITLLENESINDATFYLVLGFLTRENKSYKKAEAYYLKAAEGGINEVLFDLGSICYIQSDYEKAESYYLKAINKGYKEALHMLSFLYIEQMKNLEKAIGYASEYYNSEKSFDSTLILSLSYLCAEEFALSFDFFNELLKFDLNLRSDSHLTFYFLLLVAKGQYYQAKNFLELEEYQLKERFKPIWYALMTLMQDEFPHEIKKMGAELKETVEEVLVSIKEMETKYALPD